MCNVFLITNEKQRWLYSSLHSHRSVLNRLPEVPWYSYVKQTVKYFNLENNQDLLSVSREAFTQRDCGHIPHKGFAVRW